MSGKARTLKKERRWMTRYGMSCGVQHFKAIKVESCMHCGGSGRVGWDECDDDTVCLFCDGYGYVETRKCA